MLGLDLAIGDQQHVETQPAADHPGVSQYTLASRQAMYMPELKCRRLVKQRYYQRQ